MGSKSLSQEYDFIEDEDSPVKTYRPLRSRFNNNAKNTCDSSSAVKKDFSIEHVEVVTKLENSNTTENISPNSSQIQGKVIYMCSKYLVDKADQMLKVPKRVSSF
jgi:hypothetical protein